MGQSVDFNLDAAPAPESLSYILRFPTELDAEQVTNWLHALSGLLPGSLGRLRGAPTVVCELWASAEQGFRYRLVVPRARADYLVGQLCAAVPGVRVTPTEASVFSYEQPWTHVVELGMPGLKRTVRVEVVPLVSSLLASLQGFALRPALQSRLRVALGSARAPLLFPLQLTAAEMTGLLDVGLFLGR